MHDKVYQTLNQIKEGRKFVNIIENHVGCIIYVHGSSSYLDDEGKLIILEIFPEEDSFIASNGTKYFFTTPSEIHCPA